MLTLKDYIREAVINSGITEINKADEIVEKVIEALQVFLKAQ